MHKKQIVVIAWKFSTEVFHQFPHFFHTLDAFHLRSLKSDHNYVVRARLW